jgi:hypothetical protein
VIKTRRPLSATTSRQSPVGPCNGNESEPLRASVAGLLRVEEPTADRDRPPARLPTCDPGRRRTSSRGGLAGVGCHRILVAQSEMSASCHWTGRSTSPSRGRYQNGSVPDRRISSQTDDTRVHQRQRVGGSVAGGVRSEDRYISPTSTGTTLLRWRWRACRVRGLAGGQIIR